jgi:hypothetical protein
VSVNALRSLMREFRRPLGCREADGAVNVTREDKATERLIRAEVNVMARLKRETQVLKAQARAKMKRSKSGSVAPVDDDKAHSHDMQKVGNKNGVGNAPGAVQEGKSSSASNARVGGGAQVLNDLCMCVCLCVVCVCVCVSLSASNAGVGGRGRTLAGIK